MYNMVIPMYMPTPQPFVYRYCFTFPPPSVSLHIVETREIEQAKGYRTVLLVAARDVDWVEAAVQRIREVAQDLVYIALVVEKEGTEKAEAEAKRLQVAIWRLSFRERAKVYECFWACVCYCRKDFTWERRKWPLYARFALKRLSFI